MNSRSDAKEILQQTARSTEEDTAEKGMHHGK